MGWESFETIDALGRFNAADCNEEVPLVSVIVPTYNTPDELMRRCVASLLNQTYTAIELIVVDDGSDSSCRDCLDELEMQDSRMRVLDSGHQGVSHARNLGIEASSGKWIAFVDADDEVSFSFLEESLLIARRSSADLICGCTYPLFKGTAKPNERGCIEYYCARSEDDIRLLRQQMIGRFKSSRFNGPDFSGRGPVAKLYRRTLIEGMDFNESLALGEDVYFNYQFISRCNAVVLVKRNWYWYYQYDSSASHSSSIDKWKEAISFYLNSPECVDDPGCFLTHCGDEAFHAIESFVRNYGVVGGRLASVDLLRFAFDRGCFSPPSFEGFDVRSWINLLVNLCRQSHFGAAYLLLAGKTLVKDLVGKKPI